MENPLPACEESVEAATEKKTTNILTNPADAARTPSNSDLDSTVSSTRLLMEPSKLSTEQDHLDQNSSTDLHQYLKSSTRRTTILLY